MDRELSKSYLRKRRLKRVVFISIGGLAFVLLLVLIPSFMEPTVDLNEFKVGKVNRGAIITSVSAEGKVEPTYQEVITTPVKTKVLALNYQPGDTVDPSSSILSLYMEDLQRKFRKVKHEVALKKNSTLKNKEKLEEKKKELQTALISDSLETARLKALYENEKMLLEIGGTSRESVKQARIKYQLSKLEKKKLREEYESFKKMTQLDISSLNLEMSMKKEEMVEMKELLKEARISPTRSGVITRISVTPGESVVPGQEVARVSNLDEFKIKGKIPDNMVDKVYSGQQVQVLIDDTTLQGSVSSLTPGIEHGDIDFSVRLNNSSYNGLKPKKKVEIRLIQDYFKDTLRIPNDNYYMGEGKAELFVISGNELVKKVVRLGQCSYDYVLVKEGLKAGDRVILSNSIYSEYGRYQRLNWKQ